MATETAPKKSKLQPYQRDLLAPQAYQGPKDEATGRMQRARIDYVNQKFQTYRASEGYQKFDKRNRTIQRLIRQELPKSLENSKFKLVTGLMRGAKDNIRDFVRNTWDIEEIFNLKATVQDPAKKKFYDELNEYQLNFQQNIKYNRHVYRIADWFIEMGWAVTHTYFQPRNGYATKPKADPDAPGGILWLQEQDTMLGKPVGELINPRNVACSPTHHIEDQPFMSYVRRWTYGDVIRAEARKTADGRPIYNPEALRKLKEDFEKKRTGGGKTNYVVEADTETSKSGGAAQGQKSGEETYVEVLYYDGPLCDVPGHERDGNRYFLEVTGDLELRFRENQMDETWSELVHWQSHSDKASPFTQCILDPMINYEKVNSFLIAMGLEGQVDSMTKYLQFYEGHYLNPEILKNPKALVNILYSQEANSPAPAWVEPQRSASLDDLTKIFAVLDRWGQRVGTTDQEMGVLGDATDKTATSANMLFMAANKKNQGFSRRLSDGCIQEYKQLLLLDLMHSDARRRSFISRTGQPITLTAEHVAAFVSGSQLMVHDWITRERSQELQKIMNGMTSVRDILMGLGSPDPAVRMARSYLKTLGIKDVDDILPDPDKVVISPPPPPAGAVPPGAGAPPAVFGQQPAGAPTPSPEAALAAPANPLA